MKQFLIREFTDSTGHVHVNVEQPRENEYMRVVEAESKEEALEKHKAQMKVEAIKEFGKFLKGLTDRLNKE